MKMKESGSKVTSVLQVHKIWCDNKVTLALWTCLDFQNNTVRTSTWTTTVSTTATTVRTSTFISVEVVDVARTTDNRSTH